MKDLDLPGEVQKALAEGRIGARVTVEETGVPGVVRLNGHVGSEEEKLRVDQAARSVDGVLDVMDEIVLGVSRRIAG